MKYLIPLLFICPQIKAQFVPTVTWTFAINSACFGSAAAADLDNDGKKEIVFATYNNDGKVYCLNAENGTLKWSYDIRGCGDVAVNIYDLDKDGQLDVFVNGSCNPTAFCINGSTGALTWSVASGGGDSPATIADIDNDNKPEVIFGNFAGQIRVLNGENGSLAKTIQAFTNALQTEPVLTDVNNDGKLDIIVANYFNSANTYSIICFDYNSAAPIWTNTLTVVNNYHAYHGGALADIDKDGKLEYVIGANNGMIRAINVENGSVLWTVNNPGKQAFFAISIADVNNDDTLDVIYHRGGDGVELLNGFNGKVEWTYPLPLGGSFRGSAVTDLNGNGKLDLVSSHYMGKVAAVEPFTGSLWTFNSLPYFPGYPANFPYLSADNAPIVSDFDGDGALDVFFVMGFGTYTVNPNNTGMAFMIKGGIGNCPEWTMFRQDQNRSGYFSQAEINAQCNPTGVAEKELSNISVRVFPQPAVNKTNISVSGMNTSRANLTIVDLQGRLIESKTASEASKNGSEFFWEWNVENVNEGLYLYQIQDGNKSMKGKMIIIK
jgi:outer membrane protein assembly factor BamB